MKMILVLDNIRSTYNVGAIIRTAEGFGVSKIILSGYTPRLHDSKLLPHLREKLDHEIHKTALGAEEMVEICSSNDIKLELIKLRKDGWQIIGLENNISGVPLYKLGDTAFSQILTSKTVLILGEEVEGIKHSLYDSIDLFVEIPMRGKKESFNVSVAAGIAIYGIMNS